MNLFIKFFPAKNMVLLSTFCIWIDFLPSNFLVFLQALCQTCCTQDFCCCYCDFFFPFRLLACFCQTGENLSYIPSLIQPPLCHLPVSSDAHTILPLRSHSVSLVGQNWQCLKAELLFEGGGRSFELTQEMRGRDLMQSKVRTEVLDFEGIGFES